jgi:hypothetical protein
MATLDDLLDYIFDNKKTPLYAEFGGWVRGSRRFKMFATTHRDKIRAKLRNVRTESGMQDLRAELATAALLLREDRFTLEYEKYAAAKQRGPDFTVTFKTHTPFNVEVRRLRGDEDAHLTKLMAIVCDKVGQMPPSIINLLWLMAECEIPEADLIHAVTTLRQRAESKTDDFVKRCGFESTAFLKQYSHLSGIVLRQTDKTVFWSNSLARHKAPPDIVNAIQRLN